MFGIKKTKTKLIPEVTAFIGEGSYFILNHGRIYGLLKGII